MRQAFGRFVHAFLVIEGYFIIIFSFHFYIVCKTISKTLLFHFNIDLVLHLSTYNFNLNNYYMMCN